jgi:3-keto-disaccharide hydrolase
MQKISLITLIFGLTYSGNMVAQHHAETEPEQWTTHNSKAVFAGDSIHLIKTSGNSALLWLKNANLKNGIIELDLRGKDVAGGSFLGVAFHAADDENYDAVYFRPFNFKNPEKKDRAIQYIDKPDNDWDVLREKYPGKYEHATQPVPDPNDWFHVKIVIRFPQVKVYINNSKEASLQIEQISKRRKGKLGLWIDSEDGWFRNIMITQSGKK